MSDNRRKVKTKEKECLGTGEEKKEERENGRN